MLSFKYTGFPGSAHTDLAAEVYRKSGGAWKLVDFAYTSMPNRMNSNGCVAFTFQGALPAGNYLLEVGVGGDLRVVFKGVRYIAWP